MSYSYDHGVSDELIALSRASAEAHCIVREQHPGVAQYSAEYLALIAPVRDRLWVIHLDRIKREAALSAARSVISPARRSRVVAPAAPAAPASMQDALNKLVDALK